MSYTQRIALSLLLAFGCAGAAAHAMAPAGTPTLPAKVYSSYFVKNTFRFPDGKSSVRLIIDSMDEFERIFGAGAVMGGKQQWIDADVFKDRIVVAIIKDGLWDMRFGDATDQPDGVRITYAADKRDASYKAVTPLVFSIPKGTNTTAYRFIENGEPIDVVKSNARG